MKSLVLRCDYCGAPLKVEDNRRVKCTYCEQTNVIVTVSETPLEVNDGMEVGNEITVEWLRYAIDARCRALLKASLGIKV